MEHCKGGAARARLTKTTIWERTQMGGVRALSLILGVTFLVAGAARVDARDGDSGDPASHDMRLVGTNDLEARSAYQPTLHKYPFNRYILFVGHHTVGLQGEGLLPNAQPLPSFNPLTGKNEENGVSIVDVTNPRRPIYLAHLPVPNGQGGGAQMVRACDGNTLPVHDNKVYMLRSYASSAHEIWDVTDPSHPVGVRTVAGGNPVIGAQTGAPGALAGTHKSWWECDTGVAYIVGRRGNDGTEGWKAGNHIFVFDLSNPATPVFLRDWALDGQQPGGVTPPHFTAVPSIHGPISTGPAGGAFALAGATANRVYLAYGTGSHGGKGLPRSTTCMAPFGPVPSAKWSRLAVAPASAKAPPAGPVEIGPWILGTAVKWGGITPPGCCPSRAQSRKNTGFAGLLRSKMKMWLPPRHPDAVSLPRLPTM